MKLRAIFSNIVYLILWVVYRQKPPSELPKALLRYLCCFQTHLTTITSSIMMLIMTIIRYFIDPFGEIGAWTAAVDDSYCGVSVSSQGHLNMSPRGTCIRTLTPEFVYPLSNVPPKFVPPFNIFMLFSFDLFFSLFFNMEAKSQLNIFTITVLKVGYNSFIIKEGKQMSIGLPSAY